MTLDEQFELLIKFYKYLLLTDEPRFLYEGSWGMVTYLYNIDDVEVTDNTLYVNNRKIFNLYFTEKEAMQAIYDRLATTTDAVNNIVEIQIYNKTCHKFGLSPVVVEKSDIIAKIAQTKSELLNKKTEAQIAMFEADILEASLKRLEELT